MKTLETCIYEYLSYCKNQKRLDEKTIRAYRCDLTQFHLMLDSDNIESVNPKAIEKIVVSLNSKYKPRTAKRKIIRKLDSLVNEFPEVYKCVGETDIDKTYSMPKQYVSYRKPRRISEERREQIKEQIASARVPSPPS